VTTLSSREAAKVKNNQPNFRRHCCRIYASAVGVAVGVAWGAMGSGATKTINRTLASTKANQKIKTTIKSPCTITIDDRLTRQWGQRRQRNSDAVTTLSSWAAAKVKQQSTHLSAALLKKLLMHRAVGVAIDALSTQHTGAVAAKQTEIFVLRCDIISKECRRKERKVTINHQHAVIDRG